MHLFMSLNFDPSSWSEKNSLGNNEQFLTECNVSVLNVGANIVEQTLKVENNSNVFLFIY